MATPEQLGPLIRLWGLTTAQLPSADETPDGLAPFLISILQEAVPFVNTVAPKRPLPENHPFTRLWKSKGQKSFKDSAAKVHLSERTISAADLDAVCARGGPPPAVSARYTDGHPTHPETWISRRSVHADEAVRGSASWDEFRQSFKEAHAETEDAFTPAVVGAREAASWDCGAVEAEEGGEIWGHFTLKMEEMRHKIGKPLKDRTFPVLQMTASAMARAAEGETADAGTTRHRERREFLVVSITVTDFDRAPGAELSREKGVVLGAYASVERIRKLPETGEIEWIMATTSDARGVLPQWVQNMAVPGQISKDVPLFLAWIARERAGEAHPAHKDVEEEAETAVPAKAKKEVPPASKAVAKQKDDEAAAKPAAPALSTMVASGAAQEAPKPEEPAKPEPPAPKAEPVEAKEAAPAAPASPASAPPAAEATAEAPPTEAPPPAEAPPAEAPPAEAPPADAPTEEAQKAPPKTPTSPKPPVVGEKQEILTTESAAPLTAEVTA